MEDDNVSVCSLFVEPPPKQYRSFILRKRKQRDEDGNSVKSLYIGNDNEAEPEPNLKRKKGLSRVASFASMLSTPMKSIKKSGNALQRSISGVWRSPSINLHDNNSFAQPSHSSGNDSQSVSPTPSMDSPPPTKRSSVISLRRISASTASLTPYRPPAPTPTRQRPVRLWSDTLGREVIDQLAPSEIRRQEAIFELWHGEVDLVEDLTLVQHTYQSPLVQLGILSSAEAQTMFGDLVHLQPLHRALATKLENQRDKSGVTSTIGQAVLDWVPCLDAYITYCYNQVNAKALFEEQKTVNVRFSDFLERCLESPFSRRLDLWSFLDVPRSRLVKYPLLLRAILKTTPDDHIDSRLIPAAIDQFSLFLTRVDKAAGEARCKKALSSIRSDSIEEGLSQATNLVCEGSLKTAQGMKLQCFLFDTCLVLCRPPVKTDLRPTYALYKPPLPLRSLMVVDLGEKEARANGLLSTPSTKFLFRVDAENQSYVLVTANEHNKKQWLNGIEKAIKEAKAVKLAEQDVEMTDGKVGNEPKIKAALVPSTGRKIGGKRRGSAAIKNKLQVLSAPNLRQVASPISKAKSRRARKMSIENSSLLNASVSVVKKGTCIEEISGGRVLRSMASANFANQRRVITRSWANLHQISPTSMKAN